MLTIYIQSCLSHSGVLSGLGIRVQTVLTKTWAETVWSFFSSSPSPRSSLSFQHFLSVLTLASCGIHLWMAERRTFWLSLSLFGVALIFDIIEPRHGLLCVFFCSSLCAFWSLLVRCVATLNDLFLVGLCCWRFFPWFSYYSSSDALFWVFLHCY